jgi:hypothetical protein
MFLKYCFLCVSYFVYFLCELILCLLSKEMGLRNTQDDALDPNVEKDSGKGKLLLQCWSSLT